MPGLRPAASSLARMPLRYSVRSSISALRSLEIHDVLVAAAIELHAGVLQRLQAGDLLHQLDHGVGAGHAGAMHAGIDVDDHGLRLARLGCRRGQRVDVGGMVDHHHQVLHLGVERHQAIDRLRRHHRRGDVQALDAGLAQRLGLAQLGAARRRARRRRSGGGRCRPTCGSWNAAGGSPCAPWRRTPSPRCCGRASPDRAPAPACSASAWTPAGR